jgi:hypothetical protein
MAHTVTLKQLHESSHRRGYSAQRMGVDIRPTHCVTTHCVTYAELGAMVNRLNYASTVWTYWYGPNGAMA